MTDPLYRPGESGQEYPSSRRRYRPWRGRLPAGTRLTAAELPVIASLGIAEVDVVRKVRVAVFSTGDELQLPGQPLADGQLRYQPPGGTPDAAGAGLRSD